MKKVIIHSPIGRGSVIDVATVIRETKTLVIAGHDGNEQYRLKKRNGEFRYPTEKEIFDAEFELRKRKRNQAREAKKLADQQAAREADPRYPFLRWFQSNDFLPWEKLSLKQLKQIAAIFESVKDDNQSDQAPDDATAK